MEVTIKNLIDLGLNKYEAHAYHALLNQRQLTASEISKIGGIPHGRIYNILESLVKKGFCSIILGPVKKFEIVRPTVALGKLIAERREDLNGLIDFTAKLEAVYSASDANESPLNYIHVLTSKPVMIDKFNELHAGCKKICRGMNKPPYAQHRTFEEPLKVAKPVVEVIKSGVKVMGLWEIEVDNLENFITWVKFWNEVGEEVRINRKLPLKMLIADDNKVMFTLQNQATSSREFTSIVIEHSDLTNALIELFEIYWQKSMTVAEFLETVKYSE